MKNEVKSVKGMKGARSKVPQNRGEIKKTGFSWRTVFWVLLLMVWVFVAVVASQFVVQLIMVAILGVERMSEPVWNGICYVLSYGLALALILWVPSRLTVQWNIKKKSKNSKLVKKSSGKKELSVTKEELGFRELLTWTDIGLAPVAYVVATLLAMGLTMLFGVFPWFNAMEAQNTGFTVLMGGGERVIAFIVLVVLAPFVEEVIFRGWLYGKMRSRLSAPLSIILVSLLFGLLHFQWNVGVNVFALSVVLCVLREITGTIWAGILTHMLKNGIAFYLLYVVVLW